MTWSQALSFIATLGTAFLVYLGVRATVKKDRSNAALQSRTAESQAVTAERTNLVDQIQEQLISANTEATRLRGEMQSLWTTMGQLRRDADAEISRLRVVIEDQERFIAALINHIFERKPPPPPARPKGGEVL